MNVLITGGAGFIGSHLAEYHLNKNDHVYVVDDLSTGVEANIESFKKQAHFQFEKADILTWRNLEEIVEWSDRIYHMAAVVGVFKVLKAPMRVLSVNIAGTERILEAVRQSGKNPRVLLASSSEIYGPSPEKKLKEDDNLIIEVKARSRWNYPVSKLADEAMGLSYYQEYGIPLTAVRLFNTTGPRQTGRYGMVVPRFIEQAVENKPITVFGDGNQTRSFCDVRDMVVLLDQLAQTDQSIGEIVNAGNDQEISIHTLAEKVKSIAKSTSPIEHLSYSKAYGMEYIDIPRRRPDLTKLFSLIPFRHQWDIDHTIEYLVKAWREKTASTDL